MINIKISFRNYITVGGSSFWFLTHLFHVPDYPTIKTYHLGHQTVLHRSVGMWILFASSAGLGILWGWWGLNFTGMLPAVWPLLVDRCGVVHGIIEMKDPPVSYFWLTSLLNFCCSVMWIAALVSTLVWWSMLEKPGTICLATILLD